MTTDSVRITVTQADIDAGVREDCHNCPIARAVKRAFPGASNVTVEGMICFDHGQQTFDCVLPPVADDFIDRFDNGLQVAPFGFDAEFNIETIDGSQPL